MSPTPSAPAKWSARPPHDRPLRPASSGQKYSRVGLGGQPALPALVKQTGAKHMTAHHLHGQTFHRRKGAVANAFTYRVDYILLNPETDPGPSLYSHNRANLAALHDTDHGGPPKQGSKTLPPCRTVARMIAPRRACTSSGGCTRLP